MWRAQLHICFFQSYDSNSINNRRKTHVSIDTSYVKVLPDTQWTTTKQERMRTIFGTKEKLAWASPLGQQTKKGERRDEKKRKLAYLVMLGAQEHALGEWLDISRLALVVGVVGNRTASTTHHSWNTERNWEKKRKETNRKWMLWANMRRAY